MAKFRKKPVVIDAVRYDGTGRSGADICDWVKKFLPHAWEQIVRNDTYGLQFRTLETREGEWLTADAGDWIIRGVKGEFYPCKPDIFSATYESVES